jgi:hypothetical protein
LKIEVAFAGAVHPIYLIGPWSITVGSDVPTQARIAMTRICSSLLVVLSLVVIDDNQTALATSPRSWVQNFQSSEHKCPTTNSDFPKVPSEIPTQWEQLSDKVSTAKIKFDSTEPLQRVFRRTYSLARSQSESLFRGSEGKDVIEEVTSNLYAGLDPFFAMEYKYLFDLKWHDSVWITQTASHIYIVTGDYAEERAEDSPPIGTTFYIVDAGHLVPVCTFQPHNKE